MKSQEGTHGREFLAGFKCDPDPDRRVDLGGYAGARLRMPRRKFALPTPAGATSSRRSISPSHAGSFAPKVWKSR